MSPRRGFADWHLKLPQLQQTSQGLEHGRIGERAPEGSTASMLVWWWGAKGSKRWFRVRGTSMPAFALMHVTAFVL